MSSKLRKTFEAAAFAGALGLGAAGVVNTVQYAVNGEGRRATNECLSRDCTQLEVSNAQKSQSDFNAAFMLFGAAAGLSAVAGISVADRAARAIRREGKAALESFLGGGR